jgi:hypothetical protein
MVMAKMVLRTLLGKFSNRGSKNNTIRAKTEIAQYET